MFTSHAARVAAILLTTGALAASGAGAQSLNVDFGQSADGPPHTYAAAGVPGVWNSFPAEHNTTTENLLGLDGVPTAAALRQFGGLDTPSADDPDTSGADGLLMDDYLVTFDPDLESCIFMTGLVPGDYEVLIYARMPNRSDVDADVFVDQEAGVPHHSVGGRWPGGHQELVTFSRHLVTVGPDGRLDFHSGIVSGAEPLDGAALNGVQIRNLAEIFKDGFEIGDATRWVVVP